MGFWLSEEPEEIFEQTQNVESRKSKKLLSFPSSHSQRKTLYDLGLKPKYNRYAVCDDSHLQLPAETDRELNQTLNTLDLEKINGALATAGENKDSFKSLSAFFLNKCSELTCSRIPEPSISFFLEF